ncbi:MAG: nicotinamide-nucleotide amidohydrolase family protein [Alphaproteobacteria bacterium]
MFNREIISLAEQVVAECRRRKVMVCTVESCTGGLVAGALSEVAGASHALERGFVTYTNGAKSELVGVPPDLIHHHGAVSEAVARAMAEGGPRGG